MMTPEQMLRVLDIEGKQILYGEWGEPYEDVDGNPLGVTRPEMSPAMMGHLNATAAEWESLARHLHEKGKGNNV